jgi:putative transcriptional regulator
MPVDLKDSQYVVIVAHRLQVQEQRRMAQHAKSGRSEQRTFHTVGGAVAQGQPGRPAAGTVSLFVVGQVMVQKSLDLRGGIEAAKYGALGLVEGNHLEQLIAGKNKKRENADMTLTFRRRLQFCALLLACACCLAAQSKRLQDLAAGKILVTPRESPDPLFAESVIILVRYSETGALGLMVNKRTTVPISRALKEIAGAVGHSDPVFVGGPVALDTVLALARAPHNPEGTTEVAGDVHFIAAKATLEKALGGAISREGLRVYIGYCGWGPHQLESEVRRGGWYIFNHSEDLAFDAEPAKLWPKLIAKVEDLIARVDFDVPVR